MLAVCLAACACESDSPGSPGVPEGACRSISDYLHTTAIIDGSASAVAAGTRYMFLGDGDLGLRVFDITDVDHPVERGSVDTTGTPLDMEARGDLVYVAWGATGVVIVDAGDPDRPVIVGAVPTPDARGIAIEDTCAFVADRVIGLIVVKVSDPSAPVVLGAENTPGNATGVAVSSPVALVSDAAMGLRVVNVSDPARPFLVRFVPELLIGMNVDISRGRGYVTSMNRLSVVDLAGSILGGHVTTGSARRVVVDDGIAYVSESLISGETLSLLEVFDARDPDDIRLLNHFESTGSTNDMCVDSGYLFTADGRAGTRIVDAQRPDAPPSTYQLLGTGDDIRGVEPFATSYLVLADAASGLTVAGVSGGRVSSVGAVGGIGKPIDLAVNSPTAKAFVASDGGSVAIVSLADVAAPGVTGVVPSSAGTTRLTVNGDHVYMARGFGGVTSWHMLGAMPPETTSLQALATDVAVSGLYAYVTSLQRFYILTAPDLQLANSTPEYGSGETIAIQVIDDNVFPRPFAFIGVSSGGPGVGVAIIDLVNPTFPSLVNHAPLSAVPLDIAIAGNYMYVAQGTGGLGVFDISDLRDVRSVGFFPGQASLLRLTVQGGNVFGAAATSGVFSTPLGTCVVPGN